MNQAIRYIGLVLLILTWQSCSVTKGLSPDQQVVSKVSIAIVKSNDRVNKKELKAQLENSVLFRPASGLAPIQVYIFNNWNKKNKQKGIAHWLQNKIGKPPELFQSRLLETSKARMEKSMIDYGHFSSGVKADTLVKGQLVEINFQAFSNGRYKIDSVAGLDSVLFNKFSKRQKALLSLKKGTYYQKDKLDLLRQETVYRLKRQGYFNTDKDQFYFYVDTIPGDREVDIYFQFSNPTASGQERYKYRNIKLYPNYYLSSSKLDTSLVYQYGQLKIFADSSFIKPNLFDRIIATDSANFYNPKRDGELISRLRDTRIFKFVKLEYDTLSIGNRYYIDRKILLTPGLMRDSGFEFQVNTASGSALGSEASWNYSHLNLFGGAERFFVKAAAGLEFLTAQSNQSGIFNTVDFSVSTGLSFPGLLLFGKDRYLSKGNNIPTSTFSFSERFQERFQFYQINSADVSFAWKIGPSTENHSLTPISISYVKLLKSSEALRDNLLSRPRLAQSIKDIIIFGASYSYYHSKAKSKKSNNSYFYSFQGGVESAGNLFALINAKSNKLEKTVLGVPFAQYAKGDIDYRPYFALGAGVFAGRINLGIGIPYGNSQVLPYTKQYFVGGASSMRAFDIRTLGPGTFSVAEDTEGSNFIDQSGDIKIEMNLEYRFPIFSYLKGAAFIDVGNVWLAKGVAGDIDEDFSVFNFNDFYKEFGVGAGLGLRVDLEITVLRFDFAFPLFDPRADKGWVTDGIFTGNWLKDDLRLRIGIGYPF